MISKIKSIVVFPLLYITTLAPSPTPWCSQSHLNSPGYRNELSCPDNESGQSQSSNLESQVSNKRSTSHVHLPSSFTSASVTVFGNKFSNSLWKPTAAKASHIDENNIINIVANDKIHNKGSSLTFGKNFDNTSSIYFNFGIDINTQNKKATGDSEIISASTSYFKALGNHYLSPYIYYSRPNYRRLEDYNTKGAGFNNTYIVNEKNNINYGISYSNTSYDQTNTFDAADDKNFENYSSNIRYNFNFSPTTQLSSKLILNKIDSFKDYDSYDSEGINFSISQIIKYGTLKIQTTFLENTYDAKDTFISSTIDRKDESLVSTISLSGQLNQIIPFAKKMNEDDSIFYSLKFKHSDISSNILNYDVDRKFLSLGLTKRINLNEIF